jgi:hypothetical protein
VTDDMINYKPRATSASGFGVECITYHIASHHMLSFDHINAVNVQYESA